MSAKEVLIQYIKQAPIPMNRRDCLNYLAGYFENTLGIKEAMEIVDDLKKEGLIAR